LTGFVIQTEYVSCAVRPVPLNIFEVNLVFVCLRNYCDPVKTVTAMIIAYFPVYILSGFVLVQFQFHVRTGTFVFVLPAVVPPFIICWYGGLNLGWFISPHFISSV